ncbi:MAG: DNA-binding transcriptional regulator Fis [Shewanellaceae bacterium]|jgi:DNA-binding protein Fis|nr:DNA-binding transcriptional regulator Fis [Shewanellaceae bacterium]
MLNQINDNKTKLTVGEVTTANGTRRQQLLRESVQRAAKNYFAQLENEVPTEVYELFLGEIEAPLLSITMEICRGNQTKAACMLGINRGTLRKKLKKYSKN